MTVLAASDSVDITDGIDSPAKILDSCCANTYNQAPSLIIAAAYNNSADCCSNRDNSPRLLSASDALNHNSVSAILAFLPFISGKQSLFNVNRAALYLPPPQTDALRSIVKLE